MKADCRAVPGDSRPGVRSGTGSWRLKRAWGAAEHNQPSPGAAGIALPPAAVWTREARPALVTGVPVTRWESLGRCWTPKSNRRSVVTPKIQSFKSAHGYTPGDHSGLRPA